MKKLICILLALVLLSGCSFGAEYSREYQVRKGEYYIELAQQQMEAGNYEKAYDILAVGAEDVGGGRMMELQQLVYGMLDYSPVYTEPVLLSVEDLYAYEGSWVWEEADDEEYMGIHLLFHETTVEARYTFVGESGSLFSQIEAEAELSMLESNTLTFLMDGGEGTSFTMELYFGGSETVTITIRDLVINPGTVWGITEGAFHMIRPESFEP